jgi:hypothetical protein
MKTRSIKRKRASFDAALLWLSAAGGYTPRDEERLLRSEAVQMIAWLYELTPHEVAMCFWRVLTMTDLRKQRIRDDERGVAIERSGPGSFRQL